ncbi:MAG: NTP transferase domain-containing protein [Gemmatimonadota bacterium]
MKPSVVILAAGASRRYGRLKQVEPVGPGGEAVLDFGIRDALDAGFGRIILVVRAEIEDVVRDHLTRVWPGRSFEFVHQAVEVAGGRTKPWGTGHAVLAVEAAMQGPFAVMNADDFYGRRSFEALARALSGAADASFSVVSWELRKTLSEHGGVARAVLVTDRAGGLERITELVDVRERGGRIEGRSVGGPRRVLSGRERVSMNLWGFTPAVFPLLRDLFASFRAERSEDPDAEFLLSDAINVLIERGMARVGVLATDEEWMGVTWAEDRPRVARRLAEMAAAGRYPVPLGGAGRRGG